jgi:hypothetical protein
VHPKELNHLEMLIVCGNCLVLGQTEKEKSAGKW